MPSVAIFDTETTGTDKPGGDEMVEFAAVSAISQQSFSSLIFPGRGIPPEASAVHHITDADVASAPPPQYVITKFLEAFHYPEILVAHNIKFDWDFVLPYFPPDYRPVRICTYKSAVMMWPDAPSHKNQVLRYWLGLKPEVPLDLAPHRALYDSIVTKEIYLLANRLQEEDRLIHWSNNPLVLPFVTFGKHRGKRWDEVDYGYLKWVLGQSDMNEDVLHTARHQVNKRYSGAR